VLNVPGHEDNQPVAARPFAFPADTNQTVVIYRHGLRGTIPTCQYLRLHLGRTMQINFSSTPNPATNDDDGLTAGAVIHESHRTTRNYREQL
jgi:hypothetical protein